MLTTLLMIAPLYLIGCGIAFVILGEKMSPRDYWETPGPFFGGIIWPIIIPVMMGAAMVKPFVGGSKQNKVEKRRRKEISEANHRLELAEIETKITRENEKTTRELERALNNG